MPIKSKPTMLNGINPLSYVGVNPYTPPGMYQLPRDPTVRDNAGFQIGDYWMNENTNDLWYLAQKNISGAPDALWILLGKGPSILSLTGDIGGPVFPDVNGNINTLGTPGEILVTGNPATNTLTWSIEGEIATQYPTDIGTAIPAGGILNILGGQGIQTEAIPNLGNNVIISTTFVPPGSVGVYAQTSAIVPNVTGNNNTYTVIPNLVLWEVGGSNYNNATGVYTIPHEGRWQISTTLGVINLGVANTLGLFTIAVTTTGTQQNVPIYRGNPYASRDPLDNLWRINGSATVYLFAGDTVRANVLVDGAALTVGVSGCILSIINYD